jgi:kumamolisin
MYFVMKRHERRLRIQIQRDLWGVRILLASWHKELNIMSSHVDLIGSEKRAPKAKQVDGLNLDELMQVTVRLSAPAHAPDLKAMIANRATISRAMYEITFGSNEQQFSAIEGFAHEYGLQIVEKSIARRSVLLRGSIRDMQAAFQVSLAQYEHENGDLFRGRTGAIRVPSALIGTVEGIFGLDNRPQASPRFKRLKTAGQQLSTQNSFSQSFNPNDLAAIYNFPSGDGTNQCVGIIELGGGFRSDDLTTYFTSLGITNAVNVVAVSVDGATNQPTTSDSADGEVMLDIEVVGALAPQSKIVVYFAPNTDSGFLDAITQAVHDKVNAPSVLSISWGSAEEDWTQQSLDSFNAAFQEAALLGVTVCAAAGDNGSCDNVTDGRAHVDFPAASPYVIGCGGTTLNASNGIAMSETVWNDGQGGATGGGVSTYFQLPDYQASNYINPVTVNPNPSGFAGRGVPDVAADADPATGYNIRVDGENMVIGGTSAVAPLMSALIARINQNLGRNVGFIHPVLYKANPATDIVEGNNDTVGDGMGYNAAIGWDACTGVGSPLGSKLLQALDAALA